MQHSTLTSTFTPSISTCPYFFRTSPTNQPTCISYELTRGLSRPPRHIPRGSSAQGDRRVHRGGCPLLHIPRCCNVCIAYATVGRFCAHVRGFLSRPGVGGAKTVRLVVRERASEPRRCGHS
jgi:hypothetical protein